MKCGIYSYYRKDEKEDLFDHINIALNLVSMNSRLIRYALKIDKSMFDKIRLAVVFHDLGKVFFQAKNQRVDRLSFRGHECASAYIFWEFRKNLLRKDLNMSEDFLDVVAAILFHHHAMDIKKRLQSLEYLNRENIIYGLEKLKCTIECIVYFLCDVEKDFYRKAVEYVFSKFEDVRSFVCEIKRVIKKAIEEIKKRMMKDSSFARRFQIILMALIALDYMAARERRKASLTGFSEVINEFYNLYLK